MDSELDRTDLMLEPPTIERQFKRLLYGYGLHDSESIPVTTVLQMFVAFFNYEHKWNMQLQKSLDEFNRISLKPIVIPKVEEKNG